MAQRFGLAAVLVSCAIGARAEGELEIQRDVLHQRVRVVAQAPCSNRDAYAVPPAALARYEARLRRGLEAAGKRVVAASGARSQRRSAASSTRSRARAMR
jgi:hypothetical protein